MGRAGRQFVVVRSNPPNSLRFGADVMSEQVIANPAMFTIARPEPGEYAPYYDRYISLVGGTEILGTLDAQRRETMLLLCGKDESEGDRRYAPGKWSVKE